MSLNPKYLEELAGSEYPPKNRYVKPIPPPSKKYYGAPTAAAAAPYNYIPTNEEIKSAQMAAAQVQTDYEKYQTNMNEYYNLKKIPRVFGGRELTPEEMKDFREWRKHKNGGSRHRKRKTMRRKIHRRKGKSRKH